MDGLSFFRALHDAGGFSDMCAHFDTSICFALRHTCRFFFSFFDPAFFLDRVRLPITDKMPKERLWSDLGWFLTLPPFEEDMRRFPFFRHRAAVARLISGALRMLHYERRDDGFYVVATIQPSVSWSDTHLVSLRRGHSGLEFTGCRCRNG